MQNQYLILAENITYKNNKLSCINIIDQFLAVRLPSEFNFDMVAMCGPGWDEGEYTITIKVQLDEGDVYELGKTQIKVPGDNFTYNALAPDLKIAVKEDTKLVKFFVYKNDEQIIQRNFKVASLFVPQEVGAQEAGSQ